MKTLIRTIVPILVLMFASLSSANECTSTFPLSTKGRFVVDACDQRYKLKSVNWYGASGSREVVGGLQHQKLDDIVSLIKNAGFNSVRLPFSNQMLHASYAVPHEYLTANPELMGRSPLQIYDAVVNALAAQDIAVVLNNHTTTSEWCCGFDTNGLWYNNNVSAEQWQQDWLNLIARYAHLPQVVGADLRNEVRTTKWRDIFIPESPNWGWGDQNDWAMIAQRTGNLIHRAHPEMLIVIEGINWWGSLPILGSGDRPHLIPVRDRPINLIAENKLVYAVHNYGFTGPQHNGNDDTSAGNPRYSDFDKTTLYNILDHEFGFMLADHKPFTAPIWVSEFGVAYNEGSANYRNWFAYLVEYLLVHDLDFAYWPLNDQKGDGSHDSYALVSPDWSSLRNDWRTPYMQRLLQEGNHGENVADTSSPYSIVRFDNYDNDVADLHFDWDSGATKGSCRNGDRAIGLSQNYTLLCSDDVKGDILHGDAGFYRQNTERYSPRAEFLRYPDWAGGFTKYECDLDHYVAGVSKRFWGTGGVLCARASAPLGNQCETLWFDRGDARLSQAADDWAPSSYKGQCADDQYLAGIAQRRGNASALLCCR